MTSFITLPLPLLLICNVLYADTILLKDGKELKGIVVEDYHDRVVFSTEKGEGCLLKKDIERIEFDNLEKNLVDLALFYKDKGDYKSALYYYKAAYKLNPDMKEAQEGTLLLSNMIFGKRESDLKKEIALKQDIEEKIGKITQPESNEEVSKGRIKELWDKVGISIEKSGPDIRVSKILKDSPADEAGIEEKDIIVSIWGKLIRYMQLNEVPEIFLDNKIGEIRIVISRDVAIKNLEKNHIFSGAEDVLGGRFCMEFDGLTVSEVDTQGPLKKAGILKGDRIVRLGGGVSTRYMPLESIYKLIEDTKSDSLDFEIQRELIFWKRG